MKEMNDIKEKSKPDKNGAVNPKLIVTQNFSSLLLPNIRTHSGIIKRIFNISLIIYVIYLLLFIVIFYILHPPSDTLTYQLAHPLTEKEIENKLHVIGSSQINTSELGKNGKKYLCQKKIVGDRDGYKEYLCDANEFTKVYEEQIIHFPPIFYYTAVPILLNLVFLAYFFYWPNILVFITIFFLVYIIFVVRQHPYE